MTRPETLDDLTTYEKEGESLITWNQRAFTSEKAGGVSGLLLAMIDVARRAGLEVDDSSIRIPKSESDLETILKTKQAQWDRGKATYDAWVYEPGSEKPAWDYDVQAYTGYEGLPVLQKRWDEANAEWQAAEQKRLVESLRNEARAADRQPRVVTAQERDEGRADAAKPVTDPRGPGEIEEIVVDVDPNHAGEAIADSAPYDVS